MSNSYHSQELAVPREVEVDAGADQDYLAARNALNRAQHELEWMRFLLDNDASRPQLMVRLQQADQAIAEAETVVGVLTGAMLLARRRRKAGCSGSRRSGDPQAE